MRGSTPWFRILFPVLLLVIPGNGQTSGNASAPNPSTATQPPIPKQDLVVTVSSEAIPVSASAASVTVISANQIRQSGTQSVSDILRQVPFLHMQRAGGQGGLTTVFMRGAKENLVMVMIDGVPVNDITNTLGGSFDFSTLSTDNVERIEVVRGPMSSLYGSEAIAGVINIISRRHEDTSYVQFNVEGGNFATGQFGANVVGKFKMFDYSASGSYVRVGEQIGLDSYDLGTGAFNSTADLGGQRILQFSIRYENRQSDGYAEGSGGPEFALVRQAERDHAGELVGGITYQQQWKPWWLYSVEFDGFRRTDHNFSPAIWDQNPPTFFSLPSSLGDVEFRRLHFGVSNNFKISSALMAHLGMGWHDEHGTNDSLISGTTPFSFDLDRNTLDVNGELVYRARRLTASAGLGINKTEGFDGVFSPRVGVNYQLAGSTYVKGSWGKGFFIPSFYALSEPVIGNPALQPEYSQSFDLGIEHSFPRPRVKVSATYFHNRMTNLVDFDSNVFKLINRTNVLTQGVEFASAYQITRRLELGGEFSYLDWSLENTTQPLRYVPRWRGGMDVDWRINRHLYSRVETLVVGRRYDFQIPVQSIETVGGYSTTNLILNYEVNRALSAHVRVENLLNSNYREYIGFPNPGAYVRAGFTYRLSRAPTP
ncbi:MAG: TonB-dependent receptor [Acidobacteriia bacterium]|nr:TonB-dependent receptor [Terriglobia bacterium]